MKKILFAIALVMTVSFGANAQSDGFFGNWSDNSERTYNTGSLPSAPDSPLGTESSEAAPVGSGLLIMAALGAGYVIKKKVSSK